MRRGFSYVETVVVVGIMAFLAALIGAGFHDYHLKHLTEETSALLASDIQFTALHATRVGVARQMSFASDPDAWQVVDPNGVVKSTEIPGNLHVGVASFSTDPSGLAAAADVFPKGHWLGFAANGETVNGASALVVVGNEADWRVITVKGFSDALVSGPTKQRLVIPLRDSLLADLLKRVIAASRKTDPARLRRIIERICRAWNLSCP